MADTVSREVRSRIMSRIRGRDTGPEMRLRRALHARGLRFRLHVQGLPGRPDIVLPRFRAAVFVHGCFWHRHEGCRLASTPASNVAYWTDKFERNVARDARQREALADAGWRVAVVWECALGAKDPAPVAGRVAEWLGSGAAACMIPAPAPAAEGAAPPSGAPSR